MNTIIPTESSSRMVEQPLLSPVQALPSEEYTVKTMPNILGSLNMTAIYLIAVFFIVNAVTAASGGAAAFTYLALGAVVFFIPCAIVTAQLGVLHPHEGSLYNWTHRALGGYWSFFIGFCAWFPGVLVIVAGADIVVSYMQGLNSNWLVQPWEQGLALAVIVVLTTVIALQRAHVLSLMANFTMGVIGLAVLLVGLAGVVWLLKGNASMTDFRQVAGWGMNSGNIGLFGLITLAYLGTEVPLNMAGEMRRMPNKTHIVKSHLFWGTVLVLVGYFIATWAILVTQGSAASNIGGYAVVGTVDMALGHVVSGIVAVCIMTFFVMVPAFYSVTFSRLLLVGGIDQRLPMKIARLNKNRVPAGAIILQAVIALIFTILAFLVIPYIGSFGIKPADLSIDVYNVSQATATLVWAISSAFFFINMVVFYRHDKQAFRNQRVVPMPILWLCCVIGPLACLLAIIDTIKNSWIPQISNDHWWWIVSGITVALLIIAAVGSMVASSEASWQTAQEA
ncbi:MAG: APC family permease [Ktedonobacteraceae bacterium]